MRPVRNDIDRGGEIEIEGRDAFERRGGLRLREYKGSGRRLRRRFSMRTLAVWNLAALCVCKLFFPLFSRFLGWRLYGNRPQ